MYWKEDLNLKGRILVRLFETNKTTIIVSLLYVLISYIILRYFIPPGAPLTMYTIIPLGVVLIKILVTHILKYDYFDKKEESQ